MRDNGNQAKGKGMKHLKIIGVIAAVAAVGFLAQLYLRRSKSASVGPAAQGGRDVLVETVGARRFETRIEAIGTAYANESVDITATVSERIKDICFENGAFVKAGKLLVQLDDAEERAELEEAKVSLAEQQRELERITELREKKVAAQQELDSRQSAMESAAARLAAAEARLRDRAIAAPFAGIIGLRRVSAGALVSPGTVITTLDDVQVIKARFSIPETALADIKAGQAIEAGSAAWPGTTFTGVVASIDSRVDPVTRAVTVEAHVPNTEAKLRPGMLMTVTLISSPRDSTGVPEKALVAYADNSYAFVLRSDGAVEQRKLRLGQRDFGWAEVVDGLKKGEKIVVEGVMDLKNGSRVRVAGEPTERPGAAQPPAAK